MAKSKKPNGNIGGTLGFVAGSVGEFFLFGNPVDKLDGKRSHGADNSGDKSKRTTDVTVRLL